MEISLKNFRFVIILIVIKFITESEVCGENDRLSTSGILSDAFSSAFSIQKGLSSFSTPTPNDEFSLKDLYRLGRDECNESDYCSDIMRHLTFPDKRCHCDKLCGLMSDCCSNFFFQSSSYLTKDKFDCVRLQEIVKNTNYGISMVTTCAEEWSDNLTRELCETEKDESDILLRLPVSDKTELHIMFKNMYCAQCNFVYDFYFWNQKIKCRNEIGVRSLPEMTDCVNYFIRPIPEVSYRTCQLSQTIVSSCNQSEELTSDNLLKDCTDGVYAITFDDFGTIYRNKYCAICNGVKEDQLFCKQLISGSTNSIVRNVYSFKLIVDFNTGVTDYNGTIKEGKLCKDNEIYDGFSEKCRQIYCPPPLVAINGVCNKTFSYMEKQDMVQSNETVVQQENCTWVVMESQEYVFRNNSELFVISHQKVYSSEEYLLNGEDVMICLNKSETCVNNCGVTKRIPYSDVVESYVTLVGLIVSILSLTVTLIVYLVFPQLLNIPGKILASLIISLLFAQILFLSSSEAINISSLCKLLAILVHYFFLAAFCWMNVIAFDLWMTFSNRFMTPGSDRKGRKRFTRYSIYAWLLPVVIVFVAIIVEFVDFDENFNSLKPGYGKGVCWISSRDSLILFFVGPLAVFKIIDIISFISTAIHIARAKREGAMATQRRNTCSFIINIKLSFIMGLTWVFAFVANATNENVMWYFFIIFNSLQGLFIAICYLCTKKVGRLMSDKYKEVTTKYTSSTQITSVP